MRASNKRLAWKHQVVVTMLHDAKPKASDRVLSKALPNSTGVSVDPLRHVRLALPPFEELVEEPLLFPIE